MALDAERRSLVGRKTDLDDDFEPSQFHALLHGIAYQ
jgi:hypothetical protein